MYSIESPAAEKLIKQALEEDLGHCDITANAIFGSIPSVNRQISAKIVSREAGILSGVKVAQKVFSMLDNDIKFNTLLQDGDVLTQNSVIAEVSGDAAGILSSERTALNFLQRMCAVSTITKKFQQAIKPYKAKICDTRKTCPNFRIFEKYSVIIGGGSPHRFGLFDAVMIKDNHIQAAGGIINAVRLARKNISHTVKIEVETDTLEQVNQALEAEADIIMLDNMSIEDMKQAVETISGNAIVEASGNVSLENINSIASCGVNYISTSFITAKAGILDIGLDI